MTTFSIWYMKPEWFREGIQASQPDPADLGKTHIHLKDIELPGGRAQLERIFEMMQGEIWSPNGEACPLIEAKGLHHTSMSVGDVVVVDGETHMAAFFGFEKIGG